MSGYTSEKTMIMLLVFVVLCVIGIDIPLSAAPAVASDKFDTPAFSVGQIHGVKNLLLFVWSADSMESAKSYQIVIRPLEKEIESGRLELVFIQYNTGSKRDNDTGPLLLCAGKLYNALSIDYLQKFDGNFIQLNQWSVANVLTSIGPQFGLPKDLISCHAGKSGEFRRRRLIAMTQAIRNSKLNVRSVPQLFLNSKPIHPTTAEDVIKLLN